jgi:uncharacterized protein YwgA
MGTRREDLAEALEAIDEHVGDAPDAVHEVVVDAPSVENISAEPVENEGRARDESGRFAPKAPAAPSAEAVAGVETQPITLERPEPPKSWKAEQRAHWDKLDPEVAKYIHQREQESQRGFDEYRSKVEPIVQQIQPHIDELRQQGVQPEVVVRDLLYTRKLLATGDEATKLQTLVNVAHAVGIPLQQMLQQSAALPQHMQQHIDPQVMAAQQRARDLENQMAQHQQSQHAQMQAAAVAEVENFKSSHPYVDQLGPQMQQLLQAGLATDLDSAYSKALRLNDELFQKSQATQREAAEKQRRIEADKAAKAAKANAVSTRTTTPGAIAATTGGAPKGRRAALEDSFEQMTASRI